MTIHAPAPARHGFELMAGGWVIPCRSMPALARELARAHGRGERAEAFAKPTLTSRRELTAREQATLVEATATLLCPPAVRAE